MADISNQAVLDGVTDLISGVVDNMVTKGDLKEALKPYATKEDLKALVTKEEARGFATKEDLKGLVTKEDARAFATKDDMHKMQTTLERRISSSHTVNIRHHLETRAAIGNLTKDLADLQAE